MSHNTYPIGKNAVVYADNPKSIGPELWHVDDVYKGRSRDDAYVHIWDGTHTCEKWYHIDTFCEIFTPAGWQTTHKPAYVMTRKHGHEVYPKDIMTPGVYQ